MTSARRRAAAASCTPILVRVVSSASLDD